MCDYCDCRRAREGSGVAAFQGVEESQWGEMAPVT
jgi:hypothetical protein